MTGYGKATSNTDQRRISIEIKSLNSKQLDLSAKIPSLYREQEFQLRAKIAKYIVRGKVELYITVENTLKKTSTVINKDVFNEYLSQIKNLGVDISKSDIISTILKLPEVISTPKIDVQQLEIDILNQTFDQAVTEFNKFRIHEGDVMMVDILAHLCRIENLLKEVDKFEHERVDLIKNRIIENIEKLNISLDKSRLEQEMIYYIEKLDVTEEKVRLKKHIEYFREVCDNEENIGKKIGFVVQEIGREINTLGSKSNNVEMQQIVVNMKDSLEKIKEQMLNIL